MESNINFISFFENEYNHVNIINFRALPNCMCGIAFAKLVKFFLITSLLKFAEFQIQLD